MKQKERYTKILAWFKDNMSDVTTELTYKDNYELLIAVILSAQCTDKRVNLVTPALFEAFPTAEILAQASPDYVFEFISSITYPNNKSKHLVNMAQKLMADFGGVVPDNFDDLVSLAGVGRKTANVILVVAFNKPAMPVDTHVFRVSNRLGLTNNSKTPLATEKTLVKNIPQELLSKAHHWLILHGRYICTARSPKCEKCGLLSLCKHRTTINKTPKT